MGLTAAVAGASGYAGGELLRLLAAHPAFDEVIAAAGTQAGADLGEVHPHLASLGRTTFVPTEPDQLAAADVTFLALPHGESARLVPQLRSAGVRVVVDLGADHRLHDPTDWKRWYGGEHAAPDELGRWPYGLPELPGARDGLRATTEIAMPGCYPTAVALALSPLLAAGLVEPMDVVVVAASGTSGAGRAARPELLGSQVMGDMAAYKVGAHQHTPEIVQTLSAAAGRRVSLSFTSMLAPMPRGILATCTARLVSGAGTEALLAALDAAYGDEPFVHLLPSGRWPHTAGTTGSNACLLQATADPESGRAIVVAAIDNLGKGAAGQAIQCANLSLGLPESTGLTAVGLAP